MERNGIVAVLLLFLIVAAVFANGDVAPPVNSTVTPVFPSPNPDKNLEHKQDPPIVDPKVLNNSGSVSTPAENLEGIGNNSKDSNKTVPVPVPVPVSPGTNPNPKDSNNTVKDTDTVSSTPQTKKDDGKKKSDDQTSSVLNVDQNCTGSHCNDHDKLVACIASFDSGSNKVVVLVQNGGEATLEVKLSSSSVKNPLKELQIKQHQIERINISLDVGENTKLIVNAGHGDCDLPLNPPVSERTYFLHLPSYDKLVTPINGAYLLILTGIIFGGTWTCFKFTKRRRQVGVPYQELEMGLPESVSATDVETAEGWDQGWDDDWDEENAVKSPGGRHVGSISANGLTSRSTNRDGWENDWDD